MRPKVSIIVPIYNAEKYLGKCIDSILCQTFQDFECILVDDFSSDSSLEICNKYTFDSNHIILIQNSQNYGIPTSRRIGLNKARGKYIQYVDSDDWIEPYMIEHMYSKANNENLDIVFCDYYNESNGEILYKEQELEGKAKLEIIKYMSIYDERLTCAVWNKLIKASILRKIQFPIQNYAEDRYISTQVLYLSERIGYIKNGLYHYVRHIDSLCINEKYAKTRVIEEYDICILVSEFLLNKFGSLKYFAPELTNQLKRAKMRLSEIKKNN
ncbi:glycosyltransferase family 2 protein [Dysgonomonas sp. 521]|uniref:glycosyltransferase family 2 protein n=1 Tax=Dysgonomonas sp. 521 TaxID=2302932 RepID=UPI0013D5A6D7